MGAARQLGSTRMKSTNVRPMKFRALGASLRALETISDEAATKLALHMMFNQLRHYERPMWERDVLATAREQFLLPWRDGNLACWSWGSGPTVLLVHGWEGRGSQMGRFIRPLVGEGFRVVIFDGPGHGDSTVTRASMPDHLAGMERVVSHLGALHGVIGHSMGAGAATIAATRGLEARYVLVAPPTDPRDYFRAAQRMVGFSDGLHDRLLQAAERVTGFRFEELNGPDNLSAVASPALIIHDREDREVELRHGQAIHEAWRDSQLVVTTGLGHRRILKSSEVLDQSVSFMSAAASA